MDELREYGGIWLVTASWIIALLFAIWAQYELLEIKREQRKDRQESEQWKRHYEAFSQLPGVPEMREEIKRIQARELDKKPLEKKPEKRAFLGWKRPW